MIYFGDGRFVPTLRISRQTGSEVVMRHLGLLGPRPVVFISGGADNMETQHIERMRPLVQTLSEWASINDAAIITGGTYSGVMRLICEVHQQHSHQYPLIGVAPDERVHYPEFDNYGPTSPLDNRHTHFVLVEGDDWGDESQTAIDLARSLAGAARNALGLLINGGDVALQDILLATEPSPGYDAVPVWVIAGSGRLADRLAAAIRQPATAEPALRSHASNAALTVVDETTSVQDFRARLEARFDMTRL